MQRILLLFEYSTLNGGEHSMLAVLERLPPESFECLALVPQEGPLSEALQTIGVPTQPFSLKDELGNRLPREVLLRNLRANVDRIEPDILHANSLSMGRLTGALGTGLSFRRVAHIRDIIRVSKATIRDLNQNELLIAVSQATADAHIGQGLDEQRVTVLRNGVDCVRFAPRPRTGQLVHGQQRIWGWPGLERGTSETPGLPSQAQSSPGHPIPESNAEDALARELHGSTSPGASRFVALTVGQIGLRKGLDTLAEAATILGAGAEIDFVVVGERYSQKAESIRFDEDLTRAFQQAGMSGRLLRLGYRSDIPSLMNESDILVHAAKQEPFGRVLLEAAASGLAIVATDVGGTREMLGNDAAILVPPNDPRALASAIDALKRDESRRNSLATAGRQRVLDRFRIEEVAQHVADIWNAESQKLETT